MIKNINCAKKYASGSHFYEIIIETNRTVESGHWRDYSYRFTLHQPNQNKKSVQLFFNPSARQRNLHEGIDLGRAVRVAGFSENEWFLYASNGVIAKAIRKAVEFVTEHELKQAIEA